MILNIGGGGGLPIRLIVTAPTGSAVSVTRGTTVLAANEVDGVWTFAIPSLGVWTIHATIEGQSLTQDVDISKVGQYSVTLEAPVKMTLNDNDWATIKEVADESKGANYWAVGDTKQITMNGKVSDGLTLNNYQTWVYIIGFDHNSDKEGTGIAFQGFKTAQANGTDVALCDSGYNANKTSGQWFNMNNSATNSGGWKNSRMRSTTLPLVKSALPSDLQAVLKTTTIYSDNTGGDSDVASYVTATQDELYLLAEFEIFGARSYANSAERNHQQQYAYYVAGNSKIKYNHNNTATAVHWKERSVYATYAAGFCVVRADGAADGSDARLSSGLAVAFKVGGAKYTQLEYIQSTGTQYVNTGVLVSKNLEIKLKFMLTSTTNSGIVGYMQSASSGTNRFAVFQYGGAWYFDFGNESTGRISGGSFSKNTLYDITAGNRYIKNNATESNIISGSVISNVTNSNSISILCETECGIGKIYSCQIYDNGTLVRDFIPAKDEVGNAGLYDKVEGKFYYNAGTGSFGIPSVRTIDSSSVGQSVYCNVNNVKTEFIIVHQGQPSSMYDDSCNGTWLLMKDVYDNSAWNSSNKNSYKTSTIHSYLNNTFLNLLDIKDVIRQAKIPYVDGTGGSAVASGANGLPAKVFLLSGYEVGWTTSDASSFPVDGARLSYFESGTGTSANNKRIANLHSSAARWWLRSPFMLSSGLVWNIESTGGKNYFDAYESRGIRPAFIVPSDTYIDEDNNILTAPPTYNAISALNVGDSVFCEEDGVDTEFILVHKGLPGAMYNGSKYDASCNGAWLLRKTLINTMAWTTSENNRWGDSIIANWLNATYINYLNISNIVKTVKIPYAAGMGMTTMFSATCKAFLLSGRELGWNDPSLGLEGSKLDYFIAGNDGSNKRKAYLQSTGDLNKWWTRSPNTNARVTAVSVDTSGGFSNQTNVSSILGVRPAFIVPLDTLVDSNNNIVV